MTIQTHPGEKILVAAAVAATCFGAWRYYKLREVDRIAAAVATTAVAGTALSWGFRPSVDKAFAAARKDRDAKRFHDALRTPENRESFRVLWWHENRKNVFQRFGYERFEKHVLDLENLLRGHPGLKHWFHEQTVFPNDFDVDRACRAMPITANQLLAELTSDAGVEKSCSSTTCTQALEQIRRAPVTIIGIDMTQHQAALAEAALRWFLPNEEATPDNIKSHLRIIAPETRKKFSKQMLKILFLKLVGGYDKFLKILNRDATINTDDREWAEELNVDVKALAVEAAKIFHKTAYFAGRKLQFGDLTWIFRAA